MGKNKTAIAGFLAVATLSGCNDPYKFRDDIDTGFDFLMAITLLDRFDADGDLLNGPYVVGAPVGLSVYTRRDNRMDGWTLRSADPDVFTLGESTFDGEAGILAYAGLAVGPGLGDIELLDEDGDVRDVVEVDVRVPTRIELQAAGPLFVGGGSFVEPITPEPRVLAGHIATFRVAYFDGDQELNGNAPLEAVGDDMDVSIEKTWLFENRDWIHVTPQTEGEHALGIVVDGDPLATVPIHAVPESEIAQIDLYGEEEDGSEEGDSLALLAQAWDAEDRPIYGVEYAWDRAGVEEPGLGDLYRYNYAEADEAVVGANLGEHRAEITIHGEGWVDSSNNVGCETIQGPKAATIAGVLGLLFLGRRGKSKR